jgi:ElaB/YqjD/DUF883 family membrane-anchored ribosome-binding protein
VEKWRKQMAIHSGSDVYRRPSYLTEGAEQHNEGLMQRANELGGRAGEVADDIASTVKEHPYAAFAIAAGLAFAIGALWKLRSPTRQSQVEALMARLPEMPTAERIRSFWR